MKRLLQMQDYIHEFLREKPLFFLLFGQKKQAYTSDSNHLRSLFWILGKVKWLVFLEEFLLRETSSNARRGPYLFIAAKKL